MRGMELRQMPLPASEREIAKYVPLPAGYQVPQQLSGEVCRLDFAALMERHYPRIDKLVNLHGLTAMQESIALVLAYAEARLGYDKGTTADDIVECVNSIVYSYGYLSVEELMWVLRRLWEGKEGTIYGRLRIIDVIQSLEKNKERRVDYFRDRRS